MKREHLEIILRSMTLEQLVNFYNNNRDPYGSEDMPKIYKASNDEDAQEFLEDLPRAYWDPDFIISVVSQLNRGTDLYWVCVFGTFAVLNSVEDFFKYFDIQGILDEFQGYDYDRLRWE